MTHSFLRVSLCQVFGSTDPNSGTAALMEIVAGFGALLSSGWKSDRTIKLCSWDGEEYGLLGSVNYAESHAKELQEYAVMYLNVDVAVTVRTHTTELRAQMTHTCEYVLTRLTHPYSVSGSVSECGRVAVGCELGSVCHEGSHRPEHQSDAVPSVGE